MKNIVFFLLSLVALSAAAQRTLQPSDVYRYKDINSPQISPDGKWVAYVLSSVDTAKDRRTTDVWMVSWDGKESVQLTFTPEGESNPKWSPDGRYLSFVSSRKSGMEKEEEGSQVWVMDRRGGEARKITNIKADLEDYDWGPDGKKLLLTLREKDQSDTAKTKVRTPFVINRYQFKRDYQGYLDNRNAHLYLFDLDSKKLDTLTSGNYSENDAAFSPDGSLIAFVSNRTPEPDKNDNNDIFVIEAKAGAQPRKLTTWEGSDGNPVWSPDGKWIAYLQSSSNQAFTMYGHPVLALISKDGGQPKLLSQTADRPVRSPRWAKDGKSIMVLMDDDRQVNLVSFTTDGARKNISSGDRAFNSLENNAATNSWVALMSEPQVPTELYAIEAGNPRRLTHVQDSFLQNVKLASVQGFQSKSKDGALISSLLYLPPNATPGKKLPLILYIHGGPVSQDNFGFDMTRQMYAAAGFAVAGVNYRGSNGRGIDFTKAIYGDWGNKEVQDVVGAANYLVEKGIVDESRMGIAGWSYGGITTNYTIATDPRFKAAVSGAGSSLQLTMYGTDQYISQYETELGAPWKATQKWIDLSYPFFHADRIKTPTLFMAGQNDFNVPVAGSEQMYQALRSVGVPTELIIYPGQNHGIAVPSYIKDRHERHIAWFNKYLNGAAM
jgi:dipeptidyl aminopeptidase/acylaminoacyl peptidase